MKPQVRGLDTQFENDSRVNWKCVLCGICALTRNGLLTYSAAHLDVLTNKSVLDGVKLAAISYYYRPEIDYTNYVTPSPTNPLILRPSRERAIVEYILMEDWCDEGVLIEALKSYIFTFWNEDELDKVADFYGLPRDTLAYWIKEANEDKEV